MSDRRILTLQEFVNHPEDIEVGDIAASLLPAECEAFTKAKKPEPTNEELLDGGILRHVTSDETLDRQGDIVTAKGWNLEDYLKNPVILWAHSHRDLPIGQCLDIGVKRKKLIAEGLYPSQDLHEFGNTVYRLSARKYLRAVSVGFMPTKFELLDEENPWGGIKVTEQDLWEYSVVPVPANPNALQLAAKEMGGYDSIVRWAEEVLDNKMDFNVLGMSLDASQHSFIEAVRNMTGRLASISFSLPLTREADKPLVVKKEGDDMVEKDALLGRETRDYEERPIIRLVDKKAPVILRIIEKEKIRIDESELKTLVADAIMRTTGQLVDNA